MKALDLPVGRDAMIAWLEERLVSQDLITYVQELETLRNVVDKESSEDGSDEPSDIYVALQDVGIELSAVQNRGLEALNTEQLQTLLARPALLLELQYELFAGESEYWHAKTSVAASKYSAARDFQSLSAVLTVGERQNSPKSIPSSSSTESAWYKSSAIQFLGLAATILLLVGAGVWYGRDPGPGVSAEQFASAKWGWLADQEFASSEEYLAWVEAGANAWFNKQPANKVQLVQRLAELRDGCQQLIDSQHSMLSQDQADFLRSRCIEWKKKFDQFALDLQGNKDDFSVIQLKIDQAVRNAVVVLQDMQA